MPAGFFLRIFGARFNQGIACTLHFVSGVATVARKPAVHSRLHCPERTVQHKDAAAQQKDIFQSFHAVL